MGKSSRRPIHSSKVKVKHTTKQGDKQPVQLALIQTKELVRYCGQPAQGGTCEILDRNDKPNGTGFSQTFREKLKQIEAALAKAPPQLQKKLKGDLGLMKPPMEGGRFNSKSKWIYMEPLKRVEAVLAEASAVQLALTATQELMKYCEQPAQGGNCEFVDRSDKPNGTGFSFKFNEKLKHIEAVLAMAPAQLQTKLKRDLELMRPPTEGGRFNSKSKWLYMEPLKRVEVVLKKHV